VEAAIDNGQTGLSCTSVPSASVVPAKNTAPVLGEVASFEFIQPSVSSASK